ncbi:hypothetical protein GIB67_035386, partial [Kingdonia uniflora]
TSTNKPNIPTSTNGCFGGEHDGYDNEVIPLVSPHNEEVDELFWSQVVLRIEALEAAEHKKQNTQRFVEELETCWESSFEEFD